MNLQINELIKLNIQVESLLRTLAERESVEALDMLLNASDRLDEGIDEIYNEYKAKGLIVEDDEIEVPTDNADETDNESAEEIAEEAIEDAIVEEPEIDNEPEATVESVIETIEVAEPEITVTTEPETAPEPEETTTTTEEQPTEPEYEAPAESEAEVEYIEEPVVEPETQPNAEPIVEPTPQPEPQPAPAHAPAPVYAPTGFEAPEYIESDQDAIPQANIKVDEMISRQESLDLRRAFTINDKYRFRRELFGGSDEVFVDTINLIMAMSTYDEACEYIYEDLRLDKDNEDVIDFMSIILKHFNALKK
jgi:chemotaxis protein histidine kinase CheA